MKIRAVARPGGRTMAAVLPFLLLAAPASAQTPATGIDGGDTAWMLVATGIVLMMTMPGLALFYCGMVRKKNVLGTMAQSFAAAALVSLLWMIFGYGLSFTGEGSFIGDFLSRPFLSGMTMTSVSPFAKTIPESLFMIYQMTFAIITVALVAGAVAERMRFSAFLLFSALWLTLVYVPLAHWVWGGGFLAQAGLLDFAGGTVVHINAGIAGLVCALILGRRKGYGTENLAPYDLSMAVVGTGLLWVGWFGFNGGSAYGANSRAAMAIVATHLAASSGALTWSAMEWISRGKPSVLGVISGAVAGLGTVTAASGYILPWHGAVIGVIAGAVCFYASTSIKGWLGYDDSLDVFGVHGVGGVLGTTLTGVFATAAVSAGADAPNGYSGLLEGNVHQLLVQLYGIGVTVAYCAVATLLILLAVSIITPLRVEKRSEIEGLDIAEHGESIHA
jgi:ammonium transporter, Amt family